MASNTISFKLKDEEGFPELERRRLKANDDSASLYVKRFIIRHLEEGNGPEPLEVVLDQLTELRRDLLHNAEAQARVERQLDEVLAALAVADRPDERLAAELRKAIGQVTFSMLLRRSPLTPDQAKEVIEQSLGPQFVPRPKPPREGG